MKTRLLHLIIPLVYLLWQGFYASVRGPFWVMIPQDLGYNVLLNSINAIHGDALGSLMNPAIVPIYYIGGVSKLIHLIVGEASFAQSVISDPEFYMSIVAMSVSGVTAVALYFLGQLTYRGTGSHPLAVMIQSFVFFSNSLVTVLTSFASPESFVLIFTILLVGFSMQPLGQGLKSVDAIRRYSLASALCCAGAITSKFIAGPLLLLPLFVLPGFRSKFGFLLKTGGLVALIFVLVFVGEGNFYQFIADMKALIFASILENKAAGGDSYVQGLLSAIQIFPRAMRGESIALVILGIAALALFSHKRYRSYLLHSFAGHITASCLATALLALLFISLRSKWHYYAPYILVIGAGLVAGLYLFTSACKKYHHHQLRPSTGLWPHTVSLALTAGLAVTLFIQDAPQRRGIHQPVLDAEMLNNTVINIRETAGNNKRVALLTAVPASTHSGAMDHANQISRFQYADLIHHTISDEFTYAWDGVTARTFDRTQIHLLEFIELYDTMLFWSDKYSYRPNNFNPYLVNLRAVFRTIAEGEYERLSEIVSIAVTDGYIGPMEKRKETDIAKWSSSNCETGRQCMDVRIAEDMIECISHLGLVLPSSQLLDEMLADFRVSVSTDGKEWSNISHFSNTENERLYRDPSIPLEARIWLLTLEPRQNFLRVVLNAQTLAALPSPGRLTLYAGRGCSTPSPASKEITVRPEERKKMIRVIPFGMWERAGTYPFLIQKQLPYEFLVAQYRLETGNHGQDGMDSWGRMPLTWTLEGSLDGKAWTVLHRKLDPDPWISNEYRLYTLPEPRLVNYVRLRIENGAHPEIVRLYDFSLFDKISE